MPNNKRFTDKEYVCMWLVIMCITTWLILVPLTSAPLTAIIMGQAVMMFFSTAVIGLMRLADWERDKRQKIIENIRARKVSYKIEPNTDRAIPICPTCGRVLGEIVQPGRE